MPVYSRPRTVATATLALLLATGLAAVPMTASAASTGGARQVSQAPGITMTTPTISGVYTAGRKLTAHVKIAPTGGVVSYVWSASGTDVTESGRTITVPGVFAKKRVKVTVSAQTSDADVITKSSRSHTVRVGTLHSHLYVVGLRNVGETLQLNQAKTPFPANVQHFSAIWLRNGKVIAGSGNPPFGLDYTLVPADKGKRIDLRMSLTGQGFHKLVVATHTASVVKARLLKVESGGAPSISGTPTFGQVLAANHGNWSPEATSYNYQWKLAGKSISGATKATYVLPAASVGKTVTVTVTAHKSGYSATSSTSEATTAVQPLPFTATPSGTQFTPGSFTVGSVLTGSLTGPAFAPKANLTYKWLSNGAVILHATKSTYRVTSVTAGSTISLEITGHRAGYTAFTVSNASSSS